MEAIRIKFNSGMKITTVPLEGEKLDSQDVLSLETVDMGTMERRIVEWLESNRVEMITDPSDKEIAFFANQRQKSLSFKKSDRVKSFSLDESPLYLRHKKSSSPCQKMSGFFSPEKNESNVTFNEKTISELTKSTLDKLSLSESLEDIKKGGKINDFCLKISEFEF